MQQPTTQLSVSLLQWVPRILVACRVSILSVLAGIWIFLCVPQARDLFADISFGALPRTFDADVHWVWFFLDVVLIWAFPVHYAARRLLYQNDWMFPKRLRDILSASDVREREIVVRAHLRAWIDWIPRVLGMLPFVAILIGLWKTNLIIQKTQALEPASSTNMQVILLALTDIVVAILFMAFLIIRRPMVAKLGRLVTSRRYTRFSLDVFDLIAIASAMLATVIFVFSYFVPFFAADIAPRAVVVPLIFGSSVFLATFLAWVGERIGYPVLFSCIVLALGITALNNHFNNIREFKETAADFAGRQIDLDAAVAKWKEANGCDDLHCPPALIIAAEGGASRAAFAAATAVGALLDSAGASAGTIRRSPARRIFAISGVSGGAFGAVVIRTALWMAQDPSAPTPPCKVAPRSWFGGGQDVRKSWKACLQALVAGDFLTPAFVGLGFRDNLSPPPVPFVGRLLSDDRAALVEKAWERHFDDVTSGKDPRPIAQALHDLASRAEPETGLHRRFGYLSGRLKGASWLPLLALNATSVNTGARIVISDLVSTRAASPLDKDNGSREAQYPAAFDLFEMLSTPCPSESVKFDACTIAHVGAIDNGQIRNGADIRLSTAAMLSARFPIVSPAGLIRSRGYDAAGDRAVDGGYFENAGLTTALDIARALRSRGLTPIVLWVQNDPSSANGDPSGSGTLSLFPPRAANTPKLGYADANGLEALFGVIATPFNALTATRNGHSMEADSLIERYLQELNATASPFEQGPNFFTFKAYRFPNFEAMNDETLRPECVKFAKTMGMEMSEVSMSWWLSQAVQAEVDSQICDYRNRTSLDELMKRLSQSLTLKKL